MTLEDIWMYHDLEGMISRVNHHRGLDITLGDLLTVLALYETSLQDIRHPAYIYDFDTTPEYVENLLMTFDFELVRNVIEHETSISRASRFQTKIRVKSRGDIWILHQNDADPFPSKPHAHHFDENLKLDLSDGRLYRVRQFKEAIPKKELLEIRKLFEQRGVEMPTLRVE